ncbi:unannotated protein [freshwater metagenome]|uniref:Unannotated protein n=1 Tax=freshwater metagenome TaxID=449393 RepID=A0A6J7KFZ4_9ZZZZ|nr:DUF429 domain-containing protein [Actinomycetota bacterium]
MRMTSRHPLCHAHWVRVLGIDLAAQAASTGVVVLERAEGNQWMAAEIEGRADDEGLVRAVRGCAVVGVDSPLGWPVAFVKAVQAHTDHMPWTGTGNRSTLTHRDTDRAIREHGIRAPLSVSADNLGSVAMRCALLQRRWAEEVWAGSAPRDGSGTLVETYPAAALAAWGIECVGYKRGSRKDSATEVRERITNTIHEATRDWLDLDGIRKRCVMSDHVLDALICALVAIAAKSSATHPPSGEQRSVALIEGWIHVPSQSLTATSPTTLVRG